MDRGAKESKNLKFKITLDSEILSRGKIGIKYQFFNFVIEFSNLISTSLNEIVNCECSSYFYQDIFCILFSQILSFHCHRRKINENFCIH